MALDFELAVRKLTIKVYENEISARELKKKLLQKSMIITVSTQRK